jgi:hypothetical protein
VGSTALQPGEEGSILIDNYIMGMQMEGLHLFKYTIDSNDAVKPEQHLYLKIDFVLEEDEAQ